MALLALAPLVTAILLIDRACAGVAPADAASRSTGAPPDTGYAYAAGACLAQNPTGGSARNRTLFIDAGHGGPDPGVLGQQRRPPIKESQVALAVATELARQLRADGYRVVLSRTKDTSVRAFDPDELADGTLDATQVRQDLQARVRCANDSHAAALLSVHFNGYDDVAAGGSQTIYDDARPFAEQSAKLANSVHRALLKQLKLEDRGVITDDQIDAPTLSDRAESYGHLLLLGPAAPGWLDRGTSMPGALVEPLFLTAPDQATLATTANGQKKIAQALKSGLEDYLNSAPRQ